MRARTAPPTVPGGSGISPSRTRLWKRFRSAPNLQRSAMASTAMAPKLCRLPAYCGPGLPRPARISMARAGEPPLAAQLVRSGLGLLLFGFFGGAHRRGGADRGDDRVAMVGVDLDALGKDEVRG